jgi:hypothetical protein
MRGKKRDTDIVLYSNFRIIYFKVPQYINSFDKSTQTDFTDREEKDLSENEEEKDPFANTTFEINVYHQMQEFRQEQENISPHPSNATVSPPTPEEEGALLGLSWGMDNFSFTEPYVLMNKPWPLKDSSE